jgi:hypothetical protein
MTGPFFTYWLFDRRGKPRSGSQDSDSSIEDFAPDMPEELMDVPASYCPRDSLYTKSSQEPPAFTVDQKPHAGTRLSLEQERQIHVLPLTPKTRGILEVQEWLRYPTSSTVSQILRARDEAHAIRFHRKVTLIQPEKLTAAQLNFADPFTAPTKVERDSLGSRMGPLSPIQPCKRSIFPMKPRIANANHGGFPQPQLRRVYSRIPPRIETNTGRTGNWTVASPSTSSWHEGYHIVRTNSISIAYAGGYTNGLERTGKDDDGCSGYGERGTGRYEAGLETVRQNQFVYSGEVCEDDDAYYVQDADIKVAQTLHVVYSGKARGINIVHGSVHRPRFHLY